MLDIKIETIHILVNLLMLFIMMKKVSCEKRHHGIVGVIKTFQMMSLKMSQLKVLFSIRKQVITLQDGITDMHIAEYMTQEDLNLKSLLKIFYIF